MFEEDTVEPSDSDIIDILAIRPDKHDIDDLEEAYMYAKE